MYAVEPNNTDNSIQKYCDECASVMLVTDYIRGERTCSNCGLVHESRMISFDSEWRAYSADEKQKRARTSLQSFSLLNSMTTYIGKENADIFGRSLSPTHRNTFFRLRKWQLRLNIQDARDQNLHKATTELDRLSSILELPRIVKDTAGHIYKMAHQRRVIKGFPIEPMIAACVYAGARMRYIPRTLDEISQASCYHRKKIAHSYRILLNRLHIKIPPAKPRYYIPRIGTELGLSGSCMQTALQVAETAELHKMTSGKSPVNIAAAALYMAAMKHREKRSQQAVASVARCTEITIRQRRKDLLQFI